jgi:hypothetical protein
MNSELKNDLDGSGRGLIAALSWRVPEGTKETKKTPYHRQYSNQALPELTEYWVQCHILNN